jgi:hypothetical protein
MISEIKKYIIADDGSLIEAATPVELVRKLRDSGKFTRDEKLDEYMEGFAKRQFEYSGAEIRTDTAGNFVADLVRIGFLTLID